MESSRFKKIHAIDITHFSSPIHSMDSPPRRTLKLSNATAKDILLHNESVFPKRSSSLNRRAQKDVPLATRSAPPTVTLHSLRGLPNESLGSSGNLKGPASPRSRVSMIASTLRKFRKRDPSTDGEQSPPPVLPAFPFSVSAAEYAAAEAKALSLNSNLSRPHMLLRNAHSDSNIHQHTPSYPPRELHDADKQFQSLRYQSVMPPRPTPLSVPQDVEANSTISDRDVELVAHGIKTGLLFDPLEEGFTSAEPLHGPVTCTEMGYNEDEEIVIDAGVVMAPIPVLDIRATVQSVKPTKTEAQRYKEMILKREESEGQTRMRRPPNVNLPLESCGMASGVHITSATGTAFSYSSGTDAGSEDLYALPCSRFTAPYCSPEPTPALRRSVSLNLPRPSIDYGEVDGILGVLFSGADDASSLAWNRVSFGIPLPEGSSPNLNPTTRSQPVPPLTMGIRRPSSQLYSRSLQILPRPETRREEYTWHAPSSRATGKNHKVQTGLERFSFAPRDQKSRASEEGGDVLQNYADLTRLIGLRDGK